jgi:penicillin-binding protein 1C
MKKIFIILVLFLSTWITSISLDIWNLLEKWDQNLGRLRIYDRNGNILTDLPLSWGYQMKYRWHFDYPLIQLIVDTEDKRFFSHYGIDIRAKISALYENYQAGKIVRWGSTITEQYIKNKYFPSVERNIRNKIRESFWSIITEIKFSKEEILRGYLDTVYMGNGLYGIAWAIDTYFFDQNIENLSESAIIEILTRIKYPNLGTRSEEYKNIIIQRRGFQDIIWIIPKRERKDYSNLFPFLTARVKKELDLYCRDQDNILESFIKNIPIDVCENNDISLISSIDISINLRAVDVLEGTLYPLEEKNVHNGSIYVWSEKERKIIAYVGNRNNSTWNAIDMITRKRSVGSILKPFVYELALERWASPDSLILDDSRIYETRSEWISYNPENYIPKEYGPITIGEALGNSLNSATVRLSESLGIGKIYEKYRSLWFDLDHEAGYYGYGISLWSVELSLEDIVHGYRSLTDTRISEKFLLYDILSNTSNRARTFGISSILNTSIPLAVKTGTSTDFKDNWVVGYSKDIIIWVWVGNTDNTSMDDVSWVTGAGPIYHTIAEDLIEKWYIQASNVDIPSDINYSYICMDRACLRKSASYTRDAKTMKSRPLDDLYYKDDFVTNMTSEEIQKWKIQ